MDQIVRLENAEMHANDLVLLWSKRRPSLKMVIQRCAGGDKRL